MLWQGGSKGVPAIREICTRCSRSEAPVLRDVPFLHHVHDRLDVSGAERDVVRHGSGAGGVEVDRSGRRRVRRLGTECSVLELQVCLDVEILPSIVLQGLVDDRRDLVLRERDEFAGVGDRIPSFVSVC